MSGPSPKPGILDLPPYVGGRESLPGVAQPLKLSANESPLGASPKAVAAFQSVADRLAIYPDGNVTELRAALAELNNLNPAQIVCGNGSDELLQLLAQAYLGPGDEAIHTAHGFLIYKLASTAAGGLAVSAPEVDLTANVDTILAAVTAQTRLVFLANPNNPTGTMIDGDALRRLHAGLREDILLVIDGAYAEYVTDEGYENGFKMVEQADNVVTTRTFSKIHGLAALRLGWAYCPPQVAEVLNRLRGPFNISGPAMAAGIASVKDTAHIARSVAHNSRWLDWLAQQIGGAGFETVPSKANFLLIKFPPENGITAADADDFLCTRGIIARQLGSYGLPDALRLSVGTEDANRRVVEALLELAESSAAHKDNHGAGS